MAKKKTKVASNRGYATVSAPSKKIEPVIAEVPKQASETETTIAIERQEDPFESLPEVKKVEKEQDLDPVTKLVQKFESLNDHKAQVAFDRMVREDSQQPVPDEQIKRFRLDAEIEKELLQVVKHKESDVFHSFNKPLKNNSSEHEKERTISQLDVVYRTLIRLGFQIEDISASFEATLSKTIDDHLDWLCVHVPYERMPIGFFDKYYNDDEDEYLILLHNNAKNKGEKQELPLKKEEEKKEELIVVPKKIVAKVKDDDMKARILQAAQMQMDEEDEDINEKHASVKIKLIALEKLLHSDKKSKKKSKDEISEPDLSAAEMEKLRKDIKKLKDSLYSLESDLYFDKNKAEEFYKKQVEIVAQEARQKLADARAQLKKEQEEKKKEEVEKVVADTASDDEDDEGGLFGGLMMDEEETSTPTTNSTTVEMNIIDLTVPKSWMGRYPKDLLLDYANKQKLGKQSFNSHTVSSGIWKSSLKIAKDGYNSLPLRFELPKELCTTNKHDAEQLVALYALFELDSTTSVFKVLPNSYKDLWCEWVEEKRLREEAPRIEADKKRFSFLIDLVDKSLNKPDNTSNSKSDNITNETTVTKSKQPLFKNQKMFSQVKENFKSRLTKKEYLDMKKKRSDLPITAYREEILEIMKHNQVLIISGETGCGKSTQVPQFLAEDILLSSKEGGGSVVCTQPRRISAMSIANRVSSEMGDRPRSTGSRDAMVGYQIRLESKMSAENVLLFCTTGILLRRLESDKTLEGVTHVVVDEVHERTIESDFLLIILRKLLNIRTDLKIILMSATVEASRFSMYFGNCPVVSVPGRTYPVHVQYLEDVLEDTGYVLEEDSPFAVRRVKVKTEVGNINVSGQSGSSKRVHYEMFEEDSDDDDPYDPTRIESKLTILDKTNQDDTLDEPAVKKYSRQTRKMIKRMDEKKINYDLILELLDHICLPKKSKTETEVKDDKQYELETKGFNVPDKGAILVFLPGMNEIRKIYDLVSSHSIFGDPKKFLLIALHSALSSEHQEKAFDIPPDGVRKIVFSTNIAETGVTISDVTVVIDTGMAKVVSYDEKKRVTRLLQKYVAKANARQRRGRAGRVQEGVCFHLFTEQRFEEMANFETPEILRLPLEELCLRIKVCELGSIRDVLGAALDPPTEKMINNAILTLQEVQALSVDGHESLTPLGAHLSNLPVDVHIGKMILFGAIFRCLDPILTIAASLSFKSPFVRPFGKEDEADAARARFRIDNSDFLTVYKAYTVWREHYLEAKHNSQISQSSLIRKMKTFCKQNFLSQQNLEMIEDMKRQYLGLLISIGFVKTDEKPDINHYDVKRSLIQLCKIPDVYNQHAESIPVVNAALTAGLYPKIAEYLRQSLKIINKDMELDIHPSSMMFGRKKTLSSDFLIYNTVVMNSNNNQMKDKVYMWETASIDPVAVILLATGIDIKYKQRRMVLDDWIYFDCFARTAVLLKFLRKQLNNWLAEKMDQPDLDLGQYNGEVMDVLVQTLEANAC